MTGTDTSTTATSTPVTFEEGSWQETLNKSATLLDRSNKGRARATALLWDGAQVAIESWMDGNSDRDVHAEVLQADVMDALGGKSRKGDASKIKTVALAVKNNGLDLGATVPDKKDPSKSVLVFTNLSKAYAEAIRLTKTAETQASEDSAADEAIQAINAPKSSSTPEGAAAIVLSQGTDEAARLLLDALGKENLPAHRAFLRAISQEIAGRVPKPAPKPPKAPKAAKKATAKKATVSSGAAKAKPKAGTTATKKAAPVAAKPKPKPSVPSTPDEDPSNADMFDLIEGDEDVVVEGTVVGDDPAPTPKAKPRRGPVRR